MEMVNNKQEFSDNEHVIMKEIMENESITQRQLSMKLGVSVSTVNLLIGKMVKEGLVKMTLVSPKQVLYMLTPIGMIEKAKKTVSYLKGHYRVMYETKEKIKTILTELSGSHDLIYILKNGDEMDEILAIAVEEYRVGGSGSKVVFVDRAHGKENIDLAKVRRPVFVHMLEDEALLEEYVDVPGLALVNLINEL